MASAARLASTCQVCFDEHRQQSAYMCERAYQQLTPEVTVELFPSICKSDWENPEVKITMHWADEVLLLQTYRIALRRKALQEFWSFVWPANLYELIWTAARKTGNNDWLAADFSHYMQTIVFFVRIQAIISCEEWKTPLSLADAWAHDNSLDKAVEESLSACAHAHVRLFVAQQAVDGVARIYTGPSWNLNLMRNAPNSANAFDDNGSHWDEAYSMVGSDPDFVRDSSVDWMHEILSQQNSNAEQDQIFACEPWPIGKLRRTEYMRRPCFGRSRQSRANKQSINRIKQSRKKLDKHVTGKHKKVGLVQCEVMNDHDMFV